MKLNKEIAETLKLMNKTAIANINTGNYYKAIEIFEQSKILEEKLGLTLQAAESLVNIGNTYYLLKDADAAIKHIESALCIFQTHNNRRGMLNAYQIIGNIYFEKNDYESSLMNYSKCLKLHQDKMQEATCIFQMGVIHLRVKAYNKAQQHLNRALALFEQLDARQAIIDCLKQRSILLKMTGRPDLAHLDIQRSVYLENKGETGMG